jgi:hypothetical protein
MQIHNLAGAIRVEPTFSDIKSDTLMFLRIHLLGAQCGGTYLQYKLCERQS